MGELKRYQNLEKLGKTLDKIREIDVIDHVYDSETGWQVNQLFIDSYGRANLEGVFSAEQLFLIAEYIQYKKENSSQ
jgi:phenylalanine-4-hydroxylase